MWWDRQRCCDTAHHFWAASPVQGRGFQDRGAFPPLSPLPNQHSRVDVKFWMSKSGMESGVWQFQSLFCGQSSLWIYIFTILELHLVLIYTYLLHWVTQYNQRWYLAYALLLFFMLSAQIYYLWPIRYICLLTNKPQKIFLMKDCIFKQPRCRSSVSTRGLNKTVSSC